MNLVDLLENFLQFIPTIESLKRMSNKLLNWVFLSKSPFSLKLPHINRELQLHSQRMSVTNSIESGEKLDWSQPHSVALLNQGNIESAFDFFASRNQMPKEVILFFQFFLVFLEKTYFHHFRRSWQHSEPNIPIFHFSLDLKKESKQGFFSKLSGWSEFLDAYAVKLTSEAVPTNRAFFLLFIFLHFFLFYHILSSLMFYNQSCSFDSQVSLLFFSSNCCL